MQRHTRHPHQAHKVRPKSPRVTAIAFLVFALFFSTSTTVSRSPEPPPQLDDMSLRAVLVPGTPRPTPLATWIVVAPEPGLPDATPVVHATPVPEPTPDPAATPWPTHKPQPRLAGGPYKPWRKFSANVMEARAWLDEMLSKASFRCIDVLWDRESRWRVHAENKSSGAYGIPQALPGRKMAKWGDDWRDNAVTQVEWGYHYIRARYGNPCVALDHSYRTGWY